MNTPDQTMILILGEIKGTVAEVKEAIRELKETVANNNLMHNSRIKEIEKDHNARIGKLENAKTYLMAYIAGVSGAIVAIFHFIPKAIASIIGVH